MAQALIEMELDEDIRKLEAAGPDEDYVAPEGMLMLMYTNPHASPIIINPLCSYRALQMRRISSKTILLVPTKRPIRWHPRL